MLTSPHRYFFTRFLRFGRMLSAGVHLLQSVMLLTQGALRITPKNDFENKRDRTSMNYPMSSVQQ